MSEKKPSLDDLRIERPAASESRPLFRIIIVLVLLLLVSGTAAWWFSRVRIPTVRTTAARAIAESAGDFTVLNASGYVTARRMATVSSKVTGKVVEVLIEEGMHVKEGQVLARLDDTNIRASMRLAEAQFGAAKAALEETRVRIVEAGQELRRMTNLVSNRIATQADLDHAEAELRSLEARLQQQQSTVTVEERQVATWQQQLDDTIIRAPFAGIVTSKNAQPGEMISPVSAGGGFTRTGICTIVDMQSLEIEIDVNESYINRVSPGQPVDATLDAYPQWKIPCKVIAIIPTADRQKSTVKVRVAFDKLDPRILPEMSVKVGFRESAGDVRKADGAVTIPRTAVKELDNQRVVMVVRNGMVERRAITVLQTNSNDCTVTGLAPDEKVVLEWPNTLNDGAKVREAQP